MFQAKPEHRDKITHNTNYRFIPRRWRLWSANDTREKRKLNLLIINGNVPTIPDSPPKGILPKALSLNRFVALITSHRNATSDPKLNKNRSHIQYTRTYMCTHEASRLPTCGELFVRGAHRDRHNKSFGKPNTRSRSPLRSIITLLLPFLLLHVFDLGRLHAPLRTCQIVEQITLPHNQPHLRRFILNLWTSDLRRCQTLKQQVRKLPVLLLQIDINWFSYDFYYIKLNGIT